MDKLTRRELEQLPLQMLHEARNWSKADVLLGEWPVGSGRRVVVKDLKRRPFWFRLLYARHTLRREWDAMVALSGTEGVPEAVARPDADAIVIEYRQGRPTTEFPDGTLPATVVGRIEQIVAELHRRGVTHGDLHRENILVEADGGVTLIDWATAGVFGKQPQGAKAFSFAEWCALDNRAVAKMKVRHAPQMLTAVERDLLVNGGSRLYRSVKKFRRVGERLRGKVASPSDVLAKAQNLHEKDI